MLYEADDDNWPITLIHHTTPGVLSSIVYNRCLFPGGIKPGNETSGKRRPIFADAGGSSSVELATNKEGSCAHRPGCTVGIFFNLLMLKRECALSLQRVGKCRNGAFVLFKAVPINHFLRVEVYGGDALPYDIWRHPKVNLQFVACPECAEKGINTLLPTGTDVCWNAQCGYPVSDRGLLQYLRVYGMEEDLTKLSRFYRVYGSRLSVNQQANLRAKLKDQPTDHAIKFGRASQGSKEPPPEREDVVHSAAPTERHFSELSNREKGAKLIKLARAAVKKDHIGVPDPKDVRKWLIKPGERKYYGHFERFQVDPEYKAQCLRNGCVDKEGRLRQWIQTPNHGGWIEKDYEAAVREEQEAAKGKGKGKANAPTSIFRGLGTPGIKGARSLSKEELQAQPSMGAIGPQALAPGSGVRQRGADVSAVAFQGSKDP